LSQQPSEFL
jgi:hypothetical protein